jgi:transcription elongation factor Elf1
MQRERVCMFCFAPASMTICVDRHQKPFVRCFCCGVRAFLPSRAALAGLAILAPFADKIAERMACDDDYAREQQEAVEAFVSQLRALVSGATVTTASTSHAVAGADGRIRAGAVQ